MLIHKMHCAPRDFDAIVECLLLRIEAWKCGEQRRMNVQNSLRESLNEAGREQAHVPGQANKLHVVPLERGDDGGIVLGALAAVGFYGKCGEAAFACRSKAW